MIDLKNKTLILMVTYYFKETALKTLNELQQCIEATDHFYVIVIDNNSQDGLREQFACFNHPNITIRLLKKNIGKANAINQVTRELFDAKNIPDVMISMDGDITFSKDSLLLLDQALRRIANAGMIAMRYENNGYSPELNLPEQPTQYMGCSHSIFNIRTPRFVNVAGGIFGITKDCFETVLKGQFYPVPSHKIYCSDDGILFQTLRDAGLVNGYLDGALATHHGEGSCNSPYGRWKIIQLANGGSTSGYFEKKHFNPIFFQWLSSIIKREFYSFTGKLIASGLVPGWMQRKKRKRFGL